MQVGNEKAPKEVREKMRITMMPIYCASGIVLDKPVLIGKVARPKFGVKPMYDPFTYTNKGKNIYGGSIRDSYIFQMKEAG